MTNLSPFAHTILEQKYAQTKEDGTKETWDDVAERVAKDVLGSVFPEDVATMTKLIRERKFMPGGRYLYAAGRDFKALNNCLAGDTGVITSEGIRPISELVDVPAKIMDGRGGWIELSARSFGEQSVDQITFTRNGHERIIRATPDHRWELADGSIVNTADLAVGDRLGQSVRARLGVDPSIEGIRAGIVYGDGSKSGRISSHVYLCGEKIADLLGYFDVEGSARADGAVRIGRLPISYKELPALDSDLDYLAGWLAGYIATDGCVSEDGRIMLNSADRGDLEHVETVAALLGVRTFPVTFQMRKGYGEEESPLFRVLFDGLTVPREFILREKHIARFEARLARGIRKPAAWRVADVQRQVGVEEVFCYKVPTTERFVLEGDILTLNCFLLRAVDSREGWAKLMYDATHCLMSGGGIGVNYSDVRPNGAIVGGLGGICTGPIALMEAVNETARQIQAGGSRRSAVYASLHWWHPDVFNFIRLKDWDETTVAAKADNFNARAPMDMTNISVALDDHFFDIMEGREDSYTHTWDGGTKHTVDKAHAQEVYAALVHNMLKTGEPGIQIDTGENAGEVLRNACVTYDTEVLTRNGYVQIGDVADQEVDVWNGAEWTTVTPKVTGVNRDVYTVTLSDGRQLDTTDNHVFLIQDGYPSRGGKVIRKHLDELEVGDKIALSELPVLDRSNMERVEWAYTQGFISADGMDDYGFFWTYGAKRDLEKFMHLRHVKEDESRNRCYPAFDKLPKAFVPEFWDMESTLSWLAGYLDGDGTATKEGCIQAASVNRKFLSDLQRLLVTLGVQSKVTLMRRAGDAMLPDGRGGLTSYSQQDIYRIMFGAVDYMKLVELGLPVRRLRTDFTPNRRATKYTVVSDVSYSHTAEKVYCFTDPIRNQGMFNGVVTGQCTEVTSSDNLDVCNLGSLNLAQFDDIEEFHDAVAVATRFLLAGTIVGHVPNGEVESIRTKNRRLGLGLMGLYDWLVARGYQYGPNEELGQWLESYKVISRYQADRAADILGVSRPVKVRAIAPTGTIGILAETTSGIEPLFATAYKRRYLKGTTWHFQYVVDAGAKRLQDQYGVSPDDLETAYDLAYDPERRIAFQAWVQEFVDHGISSTLNLPSVEEHAIDASDFAAMLYKYLPDLRGITAYPDGARGGQPLTVVPFAEASASEGLEFEEYGSEYACKGGVCGI